MESQLSLALKARDEGIAKVARKNVVFIATMCGIARLLCRDKGTITADDLRAEAEKRGIAPSHFNCWGALCVSPEWKQHFEFAGYTKSIQVRGHGNLIRRWMLKS